MRRCFLLLAFVGLCSSAKIQHDCYLVDGKALCGPEGDLARRQNEEAIALLMAEQQLKADTGDLPQGDDPRFESRQSRVAFTGRADTNEKGQPRPEKGQARPQPTTPPPCPPPTTTPPPCPTTTTTTTPPPCPRQTTPSPCAARRTLTPCEEEMMRRNAYSMQGDQGYDMMVADEPVPPQVSTDSPEAVILNSMPQSFMRSLLPDSARSRSTPQFSHYHSFSEPAAGSYTNDQDYPNDEPFLEQDQGRPAANYHINAFNYPGTEGN